MRWKKTQAAPAPWPNKVMSSGSPLNWAILRLTHWSAKFWSYKPKLPGAISSSVLKKPDHIINHGQVKIHRQSLLYPIFQAGTWEWPKQCLDQVTFQDHNMMDHHFQSFQHEERPLLDTLCSMKFAEKWKIVLIVI